MKVVRYTVLFFAAFMLLFSRPADVRAEGFKRVKTVLCVKTGSFFPSTKKALKKFISHYMGARFDIVATRCGPPIRPDAKLNLIVHYRVENKIQSDIIINIAEKRTHIVTVRLAGNDKKTLYQRTKEVANEASTRAASKKVLAGILDAHISELSGDESVAAYLRGVPMPAPARARYKRPAQKTPKDVLLSDVDRNIPVTRVVNPSAIAVVIGNKDYSNRDIPSVDYAANDARVMKEYLVKSLGYKEGNIIYLEGATKGGFESIFGIKGNHRGKLYNWIMKGRSDVFVYYSGHGAPDLRTKTGYIVPIDADPQAIALTGYPLDLFYENISKIATEMKPPNVFIVIDACFSGATEKGLLIKNASPLVITVDNPLVTIPNAVVMTSSSGAEVSSWHPEEGHGMFTYFFLKALGEKVREGSEGVKAGDIFGSITDETEGLPYMTRRLYGRTQTPGMTGDGNRLLSR